jgi:hypothetical protein
MELVDSGPCGENRFLATISGMRNLLVALVAVASVGLAAPPAHAEPGWCKAAGERVDTPSPDDVLGATDPRWAVYYIVGALCFPDDGTKKAAGKIEEARQAWSKKLEMIDADWADAADWATHQQYERMGPTLYPANPKAAWTTWSAIDQYAGLLSSTVGDSSRVVDPAYLADAFGARLTEPGRLGYLESCLRESSVPVEWAMCQPDLAAFNAKKLATELRGDTTRSGFDRMSVRIRAFELKPLLAERAAKIKALKSQDPAYGEMFTLAETARKEWPKTDAKLIELMDSMDAARVTSSRRATEGCADKTWEAWKSVASTLTAKQLSSLSLDPDFPDASLFEKALAMLVGTPNGYLASLSLHLCGQLTDKEDYLVRTLGGLLSRWPGFRGPRTAAQTAILTAGLELDDRDARLEYPDVSRPWIGSHGSSNGGGRGEIAKVSTSGGITTIVFAKVKTRQTECTKGKQTNRITQIRSDGGIVYQYVCLASKVVTINEPPFPPQKVNARYAVGLKKGMFVGVIEDVVLLAYPKNGAPAPSILAGVPVH